MIDIDPDDYDYHSSVGGDDDDYDTSDVTQHPGYVEPEYVEPEDDGSEIDEDPF